MTIIDQITDHVHARKRLPNRRAATSVNVEHNGIRYVATYARFADGGVGELFISTNTAGSSLDECVRDSGVATSLALPHGCSLDTERGGMLRNADGSPATALAAAIDKVARSLEETDGVEDDERRKRSLTSTSQLRLCRRACSSTVLKGSARPLLRQNFPLPLFCSARMVVQVV